MRNTILMTAQKLMLGLTILAAATGLGAATANAAPIQFQVQYGAGYGESFIPPCPGEGYVWTAGFYNGGYWVPGTWVFQGGHRYRGYDRDRAYYRSHRDFDRDSFRDHDEFRGESRRYRGNEFGEGRDYRHEDRDHRGRQEQRSGWRR